MRKPTAVARLSLVALGTAVLCGCTSMAELPAGTPLASVQAAYGQPTLTCERDDGNRRVIWSQQPLGLYAWGTNVDAQGNVGEIVQLLDDRVFNQVSEGQWDAERVTCAFGPPAQIEQVGMPSVRKTVWGYRYMQYGTWHMIMNIFFDPETMLVVDHYPTPDPMYEYGDEPSRSE
jgi:hypothetical protein